MPATSDSPEDRARQADKIVKHPSRYKICGGCDSIVLANTHTCPNCSGYRFESGTGAVMAHARMLSQRERRSVMVEDLS